MSSITDFNKIIDKIEENITSQINVSELAGSLCMSVYEFRRIFSFVVGMPLGEYLRLRKMSLALVDIISGKSVKSVSEKYGYNSVAYFSRAFKKHYGFSPSESKNEYKVKAFTKPVISFSISGYGSVPCKIKKQQAFFVNGISDVSDLSDTECCENVWSKFDSSALNENDEQIYAVYKNRENDVLCTIGVKNNDKSGTMIPDHLWLCFTLNTIDDVKVNEFYKKIYFEYLPSMSYKKDIDAPVVEVFPKDMETDGFLWEICIPVTEIKE